MVEARDATKAKKDPKKSAGFKDAFQLVKDLATEIAKAHSDDKDHGSCFKK